jgi:transposase InsO family protein
MELHPRVGLPAHPVQPGLRGYERFYNSHRPHQGITNVPNGTACRKAGHCESCHHQCLRTTCSGSPGFWKTRIELAYTIFEYLEIFYNRQRRHSSLGMLTSNARNLWMSVGRDTLPTSPSPGTE